MKRLSYILIAIAAIIGVKIAADYAWILLFAGAALVGLRTKWLVSSVDGGWDSEPVHHSISCGLMMFLVGLGNLFPALHHFVGMNVLMSIGAIPSLYYFGGDLIKGVKPTHLG